MAPPLASRISALLSLFSTLSVTATLLGSPSLRALLRAHFSPTKHPARFVSLLLTLMLNIKALPFVWHLRLFRGMLRLARKPPAPLPPDALFRPIVVKGNYTSLPECDYNAHKSNSTYFADLDVGRTMLVSTLLNEGYRSREQEDYADVAAEQKLDGAAAAAATAAAATSKATKQGSRNILVALGGVSCHFKRELKPYEPFEIWTRVLSWDRKWVYLVSHMVRAGAVKPDSWALQPWKERGRSSAKRTAAAAATPNGHANGHAIGPAIGPAGGYEHQKAWKDAVFASSISKYVVKRGRRTIAPEFVLRRSKLLPDRPSGRDKEFDAGADADTEDASADKDGDAGPTAWNWRNVERERLRGLRLSEAFGMLDELHGEFPISRFGLAPDEDEVLDDESGLEGAEEVIVHGAKADMPRVDTLGVFRDVLSW